MSEYDIAITIINACILIAMVVSFWKVNKQSNTNIEQTREIIDQNSKTHSAYIIFQYREKFKSDEFRDITKKIHQNEINESNESDKISLKRYLNHLEGICYFCDDGVLSLEHTKTMYGAKLRDVRNKEILEKNFIIDEIKSDPDLYKYIKIMFEKIG